MTVAAVLAPGKRPFTVGKPAKVLDINDFHFSSGPLNERLLGETAQQHGITLTGCAAAVWWMFRGEGYAIRGAAEDGIAGGEAYGDGAHRPGRPLRGVHGRVSLSDHVRRQRLEVDATVRDEVEV